MVQGVPKSGTCTRCPEQEMGRFVPVSNSFGTTTETFSNTIPIPLAIAGSRPRAGWPPALNHIGIFLSYQQQAGIQDIKLP